MKPAWYFIDDIDKIDSPALVIYLDRVRENIKTLLGMIDDISRLRPHVKTHKSPDITKMLLAAGITKFKCATIAEAEMLGQCQAPDVLLAYQPGGPKIDRFLALIQKYPETKYACLVDNEMSARMISDKAKTQGITIPVYLDMNVGMNRTGIKPGDPALQLVESITELEGIRLVGLHVYDGHLHETDYAVREQKCNDAFRMVENLSGQLQNMGMGITIVAGGSPTFPIHANRGVVECSPGTFVYWDKGYQDTCQEQDFLPAALVISRVISQPGVNRYCLDLGHKSIAPENPLNRRVHFYTAPDVTFAGQSEEHLVIEDFSGKEHSIGEVHYGVPIHICPTVALYDHVLVAEEGKITGKWPVTARDRALTI